MKTGFRMLLAPQIILNSLPTVQSNKSISGVMAEGDLWAVHALYLIVIVNPRFKAWLQLTGPRTASAMTKSGAYYSPGIHTIRMFLDTGSYIPPHIWMCIYNTFMYMCMCIVHPRQNLTKLGLDGRERTETHSELFSSTYYSPIWLVAGDAHTQLSQFSSAIQYAKMFFSWWYFLFCSVLKSGNQHLTTKWKLLQILFKLF